MMIVIGPPSIDDPLGFCHAQEQLSVEQFITKAGVERFDVSVFPRRSFSNVQGANFRLCQPTTHRSADEFWSIVTANELRASSDCEQVTQNINNLLGPEAAPHLDCQAFSSVLVDDHQ